VVTSRASRMSLKIPDHGLQLECSAKSSAGLPLQAFAISLSDGDLENMIACVQNGQDIQLSLGSTPVSPHWSILDGWNFAV
jgi:RNA polymerase II elongation factor ELL